MIWLAFIAVAAIGLAFVTGAITVKITRPRAAKWVVLNTLGAILLYMVWSDAGDFTSTVAWVAIAVAAVAVGSAANFLMTTKPVAEITELRPAAD